jgi:RNA recognition motif-containing protein
MGGCVANKVYVGNLSYDLTDDALRSIFSGCGEILELKIVKDFYTGKARGFGFVTFGKPEAVEKAVALDGTMIGGRSLRVSVAQDRGRSSSFFHGRGMSV